MKRWLALILAAVALLVVFLRPSPAYASACASQVWQVWPSSGSDRIERAPDHETEYARTPPQIRLERTRAPRSLHRPAAPPFGAFAAPAASLRAIAFLPPGFSTGAPSLASPFVLSPARARARLMVFLN